MVALEDDAQLAVDVVAEYLHAADAEEGRGPHLSRFEGRRAAERRRVYEGVELGTRSGFVGNEVDDVAALPFDVAWRVCRRLSSRESGPDTR
jgi:hypothetical protein